ncbi:HK97 family phage prohead protease [Demequina gelatinilytica]|uniref:HK97 family phage prohead protease n=1 Tax=Demequina gelatinilytica TaxID=1638980 RepID=UPI0007820C8D|nr:HK97 family phage prohead protease [Demequina gelatinilytica]
MNDKLEIRTGRLEPVELRAADGGIGVLAGYASRFNSYSQNLGGFVELVDPAAFNKSIADAVPVMARYNHEDAYLLGTTDAGTLRLSTDNLGLAYEVDLPDTGAGRDLRALAGRGDVRHSSFAFYTMEDEWSVTDQGFPLRILRSVQLIDVAPVNNPAYRDTTAAVRSLSERIGMDLDEFATLTPEARKERLLHETPPAPAVEEQHDDEQRATHSPIALMQRRLILDDLR